MNCVVERCVSRDGGCAVRWVREGETRGGRRRGRSGVGLMRCRTRREGAARADG